MITEFYITREMIEAGERVILEEVGSVGGLFSASETVQNFSGNAACGALCCETTWNHSVTGLV